MQRPLILDAARTPFGRYRGGLSGVRVDDLAALPISELLRRHPDLDPARVDDVLYGNTNGAGEENRNIGRMAALLAGLPPTVPGASVNRLCASGGEAIVQASRALAMGDADVVVAGGVEGMTRAPFVVPRPDRPFADRLEPVSTALGWRLVNPRMPSAWTVPLGRAAEQVAAELGITRERMDQYALRSHRRASAAWDAGVHDGFAFPVQLPDGSAVRRDESVRPETSAEKLAKLKPAFSDDGTVTAGNSSPLNDGAAAVLLGTESLATELGVTPLGEVLGSAVTAGEPQRFTLAPVGAIRKLLGRLGIGGADVDLWEINEAFAAMALSVLHHLPEVDREKVNVHGGAIAYGHPLGASMPRVVVDLCRHLRARGGGVGVAAACVGVGQGMAIAVRV
ncbi:thiolase family protein [Actinosynnema pretiosum subsp. pretiosum]|uniref:Probable acetyl-CoA acetyltransferase n=2 Tax=Actinosynnema TaxID=40566 RepID=C6WDZ0_ACTMD|nr:thiolase family protein [Actinosynnema mirum]ACU34135.1 acetyl-CoA acetyltransferase [Actinosynnema mirum DSM 43827]AXX27532.1 3-ketoacyl-CoA thiolase [Actinosynnema pretiosum subsp. pretiosum]QUF01756.1 thiolase family protein [Actinosynnema pretiosum subsp. pretiosum]